MSIIPVGRLEITASGGSSQALVLSNKMCRQYFFSFRSTGTTPVAGTTSVSAKSSGGDSVVLRDINAVAVNVDPTSPSGFSVEFPLDTVYFTPSSWTVGAKLICEAFGEI